MTYNRNLFLSRTNKFGHHKKLFLILHFAKSSELNNTTGRAQLSAPTQSALKLNPPTMLLQTPPNCNSRPQNSKIFQLPNTFCAHFFT